MLSDFNMKDFTRDIDFENFIEDYPNISVTTIPISTIKAEYFLTKNRIDEAIKLLKKGIKANPYIGRSEVRLSEIYFTSRPIKDSAIFYANRAYLARPLNSKHFLIYIKSLVVQNQINELDSLIKKNFNSLKKINQQDRYLPTSMLFYLSSIYQYRFKNKKKYDSIAIEALKTFPDVQDIKLASNFIIYGKDSVQKALELDQKALFHFENKNYEESFNLYSKSVSFWPNHEYSIQRAGIAAYLSQNYTKSIFYLKKLLEIDNPTDGISELYLYESYKKINDSLNSCKYYNKLLQLNSNLIDKNKQKCF